MGKVDDCNVDSGGRGDRVDDRPGSICVDDPALIAGELKAACDELEAAVDRITRDVLEWEKIIRDVWVTYSGHKLECTGGQILFDGKRFGSLTRGKKLVAWDMMRGLLLAHYELPLPEHFGGAVPVRVVAAAVVTAACVSYDEPSDTRDMAIGDAVYAACSRFPEVARTRDGRREIWFEASVDVIQDTLKSIGFSCVVDSRPRP